MGKRKLPLKNVRTITSSESLSKEDYRGNRFLFCCRTRIVTAESRCSTRALRVTNTVLSLSPLGVFIGSDAGRLHEKNSIATPGLVCRCICKRMAGAVLYTEACVNA